MRLWLPALGALMMTAPAVALEPWVAFEHGNLLGFKDERGAIKVEPKLAAQYTVARRFEHIIATGEEEPDGSYRSYYLLRDGRQVAADSLYIYNNTPICESENSIRFRDHQRDTVGFLDGDGQVLIAAELSDATPMRNGMVVALKGAIRTCAEPGRSLEQCEHKSWSGGTELLLDRHGNTLVENFDIYRSGALDWFSRQEGDQPSSDPRRVSFKGVDGRYMSFVDIEKDFAAWFKDEFLPSLDDAALKAHSYPELWSLQDCCEVPGEWKTATDVALRKRGAAVRKRLESLRASAGYVVVQNPHYWPLAPDSNPQYFDGCNNFTQWKTPLVSVLEHGQLGSHDSAEHASFDFIRSANGYRLISFSIPGQ